MITDFEGQSTHTLILIYNMLNDEIESKVVSWTS